MAHGYPLQDHGNANGNGMAQPVDATKIVDQAVEGTQIVGQAPLACIRHSQPDCAGGENRWLSLGSGGKNRWPSPGSRATTCRATTILSWTGDSMGTTAACLRTACHHAVCSAMYVGGDNRVVVSFL